MSQSELENILIHEASREEVREFLRKLPAGRVSNGVIKYTLSHLLGEGSSNQVDLFFTPNEAFAMVYVDGFKREDASEAVEEMRNAGWKSAYYDASDYKKGRQRRHILIEDIDQEAMAMLMEIYSGEYR